VQGLPAGEAYLSSLDVAENCSHCCFRLRRVSVIERMYVRPAALDSTRVEVGLDVLQIHAVAAQRQYRIAEDGRNLDLDTVMVLLLRKRSASHFHAFPWVVLRH
jgi:hypothetical protein